MPFQFLDNYEASLGERCTEHETNRNTDLNIFYKHTHVSTDYQIGRGYDVMSLVMREPVFRVSDQVLHKPGCTATEGG